jgi:uncharacterized membrane protein (DUF2068 family)
MAGGGGSGTTTGEVVPRASTDTPPPHVSPNVSPGLAGRPVGLRLIITYKLVKAAVQAALAALLPILQRLGVTSFWALRMTRLAEHLAHRSTAALARRIAALLTPTHLALISVALALDAALTGFEAWALHRRFRWAPWLVVVAGSTLIPFEVVELARRPRVGRAAILVVNLVIIAYLVARARQEHVKPNAKARAQASATP